MKLHGLPLSPFVRKTRVALELKGFEYESVDVFPGTRTPEYLAISPLGKIPAFEDGDVVLCDSNVIIEYLEDQYPEIPVRPTHIADRARSRWLEEWGDSQPFSPFAGDIFMEQMTKPFQTKEPADMSVVENSIENLVPPLLDYSESQLPEEGFIFGEMGVADIAMTTAMINASYAGYEVDASRWPKVAAHLELVMDHPVVVKCMQSEERILNVLNAAVKDLANAS